MLTNVKFRIAFDIARGRMSLDDTKMPATRFRTNLRYKRS